MLSPEDQQIKICLIKSNVEEYENALIYMCSMLPELEAEHEQKYHETMKFLKIVRSFNTKIEKLKLENISLTVKRMHLKLQCKEVTKALEISESKNELIAESLKDETIIIRNKIHEFEESVEKKAERFRSTHWYYDKEKVSAETNKVNDLLAELKLELDKKQNFVDELKNTADSIHPDIPDNILEIMGKLALDQKVKELTEKFEVLDEKRKRLLL